MRLGNGADRGSFCSRVQIVTMRRTPAARARGDDARQFALEIREIQMAMAVNDRASEGRHVTSGGVMGV
jgi:hypothetical protein